MPETNRLQRSFTRALELPESTDVTVLKYRDIMQWDSIGHMTLIAEIESEYGVMFSTDQVLALSSYDKAVELLREQGIDEL
jgi:acyl carrier protein